MTPPLWLRKLLRPLIPDRVMAAFRLHQHSRQVRNNVDIVVDGWWRQRRWLATTPDTYRVRGSGSFGSYGPPTADVEIVATSRLSTEERARLLLPLRDPELAASVLAATHPPRLVGGRRTEPVVDPFAVALRAGVAREVGPVPPVSGPQVAHARIRDAGHRYAVVPSGRTDHARARQDLVLKPALVVLALVPMHDVGGGSRGAQLTQEFLRQGWHVSYVALYGSAESVDLGLRFLHPELEQYRAHEFHPADWSARVRHPDRVVLVEAPADRYLQLARRLKASRHRIIYDLIDDWSAPSLGGDWYDHETERLLAEIADARVASAPDLCARLRAISGRDTTLVPNAVDAELFRGDTGPVPEDLPGGDGPVLGYHGSLYGDWFDWDVVRRLASELPEARVVLVGDPPSRRPAMPGNVAFLGLKPHFMLPAYVRRFDVGLLPFVVNDVTHAVSPLKVYEYLAAGVPVVAPPLRSLAGLRGVVRTADTLAAVRTLLCERVPSVPFDPDWSWRARARALVGPPRGEGRAAEPVLRPASHLARDQRWLRG